VLRRAAGGQIVTVVDRHRAMVGEPAVVSRSGDTEDGGPGASGELNRDRTDTAACTRDRYCFSRYEAHRPHRGVGSGARDKQRAGHLPGNLRRLGGQLVCGHCDIFGVAGAAHGETDDLVAHSEIADAETEFGHHARQVAALTRGKRGRELVGQGAAPDHRLTRINAGCPDLD
jgi:hypothetical protein